METVEYFKKVGAAYLVLLAISLVGSDFVYSTTTLLGWTFILAALIFLLYATYNFVKLDLQGWKLVLFAMVLVVVFALSPRLSFSIPFGELPSFFFGFDTEPNHLLDSEFSRSAALGFLWGIFVLISRKFFKNDSVKFVFSLIATAVLVYALGIAFESGWIGFKIL